MLRKLGLAQLDPLPQLVLDDTQLRHLGPDPFGFRVRTRHPLAAVRVLDEALPVPDQHASIKLVVDDAIAPAGVAPDRRVAPTVAERAGNAIPVQIGRDGAWRFSNREFPEDTADNRGLGLIDLAFAPNRLALAVGALYHVVAVAEPAARLALLHPTAQTTMGLGGEVFQEQGVHRALETDMKFGDFAFGQGDDLHAGETQMLEQRRHIGLIARDAVQGLGEHNVEPAALGVLQQRLDTRPENDTGTRDSGIVIGIDDLPTLPARMLTADTELVLD